MKRGRLGICLLSLISCLTREAVAQEATWLKRGREALMERDAATARWAFGQGLDQADDTETRWRLLLGLALANELEGATLEAVYAYRRFLAAVRQEPGLSERAPWPGRRERALSDVRRLETALMDTFAKVAIESTPAGATVIIDGDATEHVTPAVVYVAAGTHQVRLELEGHQPATIPLDVATGELPLLQPELQPVAVAPSPVEMMDDQPSPWLHVSGAMSMALGGALTVAGGALHASALSTVDELDALPLTPESIPRDDTLRARVDAYETAFITCYAAGGTLVASGVGLLIADALGRPQTTAFVAPQSGGARFGLQGRW